MLLDIEQKDKNLIISYYDKNGNTAFKVYKLSNIYEYVICNEDDENKDLVYKNWDGRPVKKIKSNYLNKYAIINFLDNIDKKDEEEIFSYNFPKVYYFDIEVEITSNLADSLDTKSAKNKILTISLLTPENKIIIFGLNDLTEDQKNSINIKINDYFKKFNANFKFIYKKFNSEYEMVYRFMSMVRKIPMLAGWNCIDYDWEYLVNRCRNLGINPNISSPTLNLNKNNIPKHVGILDYEDFYMNWDRSIGVKENGKLETAAKNILGIGKIKYDKKLKDLYETDYEKFIFYNSVDSILVYYIDQHLKTMQIALTLSNICKIGIYKANSPVAIAESFLVRELYKENKIVVLENKNNNNKEFKYKGAYVKNPIIGKYNAVACFDYSSLYPSIMRQFNISADSFKYKIDNMSVTEIENLRKQSIGKEIITVNNCVYNATHPSILKRILTDLYSKRKEYKKKSAEYKMLAFSLKEKLAHFNK